jgi:hypothetical protein
MSPSAIPFFLRIARISKALRPFLAVELPKMQAGCRLKNEDLATKIV